MKSKEEVVSEFNEYVNMTAEELESWLKSGDSNGAGWPKDDAEGDGETVGHDSGRNIVEILKANPEKREDGYTDEQIEHMRKVVSYWWVCHIPRVPPAPSRGPGPGPGPGRHGC